MCLHANIVIQEPTDEIRVGYKVGCVTGEKFVTGDRHATFDFNTWITDCNTIQIINEETEELYPCGFHIFKDLKDAQKYKIPQEIIVKVEYRKVVASGQQYLCGHGESGNPYDYFFAVDVAREICVKEVVKSIK